MLQGLNSLKGTKLMAIGLLVTQVTKMLNQYKAIMLHV